MLTRFTRGARSVLGGAYQCAVLDSSPEIGAEHLLEALLDEEEGRDLLEEVAGDAERTQIRAEIEHARRTANLTAMETNALAGLGIEVDAVIRRIEEQLGAGALADPGRRSPSRWRPAISGSTRLVLEEAERQLGLTGGRSLAVVQLALGLVSAPTVVSDLLARRGVTVLTVRTAARAAAPRGGPR